MDKKYDAKELRDNQVDNEQEITDSLNRLIERAKIENRALQEILNKMAQKKPGDSN